MSVTVNWKVSDSPLGPTFGAVKVGVAAVGSDRVTWVPANRVHWYETIPSSGSVEFEPSSVTVALSYTVWSGPASAVGGRFIQETLTIQVAVDCRPPLSVTVSWKVNDAPPGPTFGAVKDGLKTVVLESVTGVPPVCVQRYDAIPSSGSVEFEPSSVTVAPSATV